MHSYSNQDAPLLELSSYLFSKYTNFEADVYLASRILNESRREIWHEKWGATEYRQTDRQNPERTKQTLTYGTSTPAHPCTNLLDCWLTDNPHRVVSGWPLAAKPVWDASCLNLNWIRFFCTDPCSPTLQQATVVISNVTVQKIVNGGTSSIQPVMTHLISADMANTKSTY